MRIGSDKSAWGSDSGLFLVDGQMEDIVSCIVIGTDTRAVSVN